jgi:hypothetical protein
VAIATASFHDRTTDGRDDIAIAFNGAGVAPFPSPGLMILLAQVQGGYQPKAFTSGQTFLPVGRFPTSIAAGQFTGGGSYVAVGNKQGASVDSPALSVFVQDASQNITSDEVPVPAPDNSLGQGVYLAAGNYFTPDDIAIAYKLVGNKVVILSRNETAPHKFKSQPPITLASITQALAIATVKFPSSTAPGSSAPPDSIVVLGTAAGQNPAVNIIENNGSSPSVNSCPVHSGAIENGLAALVTQAAQDDPGTYIVAVAHGGQDSGVQILQIKRQAQGGVTCDPNPQELGGVSDPSSVAFVSDGSSLVVGLKSNKVAYFNLAGGTFEQALPTPALLEKQGSSRLLTAGRFHRNPVPDGGLLQDLAYVSTDENDQQFLHVLPMGGGGEVIRNFTPPTTRLGSHPVALATGQFRSTNPDNTDDVAILDDVDLLLKILLSNYETTNNYDAGRFKEAIGSPIPLNLPSGFIPRSIVVEHFRADPGMPLDILVASDNPSSGTGEIRILFGHGDGTFALLPDSPPIMIPGLAATSVIAGDFNFNNDGRVDVAFKVGTAAVPPAVRVLFNNGAGQFPTSTTITTGDSNFSDLRVPLVKTLSSDPTYPLMLSFVQDFQGSFRAAYGVTKDSTSSSLKLVPAANLPLFANVCGIDGVPVAGVGTGWLLNATPIVRDFGGQPPSLSLVSATPGQPLCNKSPSVVLIRVTSEAAIVCGDADCLSHSELPAQSDLQSEFAGMVPPVSNNEDPGASESSSSIEVREIAAGTFLDSNLGNGKPDIAVLATMSQVVVTPGRCQATGGSSRVPSATHAPTCHQNGNCFGLCNPDQNCVCRWPNCNNCDCVDPPPPPTCAQGGACQCTTTTVWNFVSVMANTSTCGN